MITAGLRRSQRFRCYRQENEDEDKYKKGIFIPSLSSLCKPIAILILGS